MNGTITAAAPRARRAAQGKASYSTVHLGRLSFIRRARDLGFSIDQMRDLLGLSDQRDRPCEAVDAIAREHLTEVKRKIRDLQALRRELDSILSQCSRGRSPSARSSRRCRRPKHRGGHPHSRERVKKSVARPSA